MISTCRQTVRKKLLLCLTFVLLTPLVLCLGMFSLYVVKTPLKQTPVISFLKQAEPRWLYAALPPQTGVVKGDFTSEDARPVHVKKYLERYNSPLLPYADFIIDLAEKYDIDFRLPLAIAQCESNVCKKIPDSSYNCWGFENGATKFESYEHALDRVFRTLKEGYIDQGLTTPEEIMPKYAPPSVEKGGPWAKCVSRFIQEME